MDRDPLDLEVLVQQARSAAGLEDLGGESWREGLGRLLAAVREEARLNALGTQVVAGEIVGYLGNRLALTEWRRKNPEMKISGFFFSVGSICVEVIELLKCYFSQ